MKDWILFIVELSLMVFWFWVAHTMEKGTENSGVIFILFLIFWELKTWRK